MNAAGPSSRMSYYKDYTAPSSELIQLNAASIRLIYILETRRRLDTKMSSYPFMDSHVKIKTYSRPSYL